MSDVTHLLNAIDSGDTYAAEQLLPIVYDELRRLAYQKLSNERPGHTLQATALVNEAYLRLVKSEKVQRWNGKGHFFIAAAEAMQRILIESARRKQQVSRGGGQGRVDINSVEVADDAASEGMLAVHESLERFEAIDAESAKLVKLRYFVGMTMAEAAEALGISLRTAERNWTYARTWLHRDLS
jgi:RNA polymerase sigma factor (TIGR02999 family)